MKKHLLLFIAATAILVSCNNDDDGDTRIRAGADVSTGVVLNGKEIIVKDANIGALYVGDRGTYLTWRQAISSCPEGYHLMTKAEAEALFANDAYNTGSKLRTGKLAMPLSGLIFKDGLEVTLDDHAYYNLFDYDDSGEKAYYFQFEDNGSSPIIASDRMDDFLVSRCVKGSEPER